MCDMRDEPVTHSLLAMLGSEDVRVLSGWDPSLSGSYFLSHPGPFAFFTVRLILEANFALLLAEQLVQPKWRLKNCELQRP